MPNTPTTLAALFAKRLIRAAVVRGAEATALWAIAGVTPDGDELAPIPDTVQLALWEHIMRTLDDPAFPIHYAQQMSIDDYGVLGLACKTAPDLDAGLRVIERYLCTFAPSVQFTIERSRGAATIAVERVLRHRRLGVRCAVESTLAEILVGIRDVIGRPIVPRTVTFTHAAPRDVAAHVQHFGVRPQFGGARNAFALDARAMREPTARNDAALFRYLNTQLVAIEASRAGSTSTWCERTRGEILRQLPRLPSLSSVGRAVGVSARSLQRHLTSEGTAFREVLDQVRCELADAMIADRDQTVGDVAYATGFVDTSSFCRAYRRWTGRPPRSRANR